MKIFTTMLFLASVLFAVDGYSVYKKVCAKCHVQEIGKKETLRILSTLKAPPMIEVANRLKENIIIADDDEDVHREVIIAFIKHYIDNPSIMYSMCHAMALEKFDVMPSLKGKLTDEEKQAVAEWVYDYYEGKEFK